MACSQCSLVPRCLVFGIGCRLFVHGSTEDTERWEQYSRLMVDWEQTGTKSENSWELTDQTFLRYLHSRRDPCRSRYRSQPSALRQRAALFLSVCVHNDCTFWRHFSSTSLMETLVRISTHGPMTSSQGSPSYRSICWSDAIWTKSAVSSHQTAPLSNLAFASAHN